MERYDVVIIGSGVGSLTAGATLARQGKRVLLLEQHNKVGGYAHTFKRKGYTFDTSLHQIGGVHKTGLKRILKTAGVYDRVKWLKHEYLSEVVLRDGTTLAIPNGDVEAYQEILSTRYPEERKAIKSWFSVMKRVGEQTLFFEKRLASPLAQGVIWALAPLLVPSVVWGIFARPTLDKYLNVKNDELRELLLHFSLYITLSSIF